MTTHTLTLGSDIERLVVLGDPHGDIDGVRQILDQEQDAKTCIVCVGDVVGYATGPESSALCALMERLQIPTVQGNHEDWISPYGELAIAPRGGDSYLTEEAQAWVRSLPHQIRLVRDGALVALLIHSIRDPYWDWINPDNAPQFTASLGEPGVILAGHSHRPKFIRVVPGLRVEHTPFDFVARAHQERALSAHGSLIIDAGSIGRPDGAELDREPPAGVPFGDLYGTYAVVDIERSVARICRIVKYGLSA